MPPAGLEPAALCLASSIRLSLTARSQDSGLLAGLYLGHRSPDPYSLWGVQYAKQATGFLRITQSSWIVTHDVSTRGSKGVPAYRVVHSMSSKNFPH